MARPRARLVVRVSPRASRDGVGGYRDGALIVRVTAPPVDSAANEAVIQVLARALDLPKRDLEIVRGLRSREKHIEIDGLTEPQVAERLAKLG
jgi:uncharacterized protein (TIGR00251 family)